MIPVSMQPEPESFDAQVRQPGLAWLAARKIPANGPPPRQVELPPTWAKSGRALWNAYGGVCAYLAIFFDWPTGANSTDHFIPKSRHCGQAYEWSNYRLSCLGPNRQKNKFEDVLDPFELEPGTFELNLVSGEIRPGRHLRGSEALSASRTIERLKLASADHSVMRQQHFRRNLRNKDEQTLKELSPFVWYEAKRQELL